MKPIAGRPQAEQDTRGLIAAQGGMRTGVTDALLAYEAARARVAYLRSAGEAG